MHAGLLNRMVLGFWFRAANPAGWAVGGQQVQVKTHEEKYPLGVNGRRQVGRQEGECGKVSRQRDTYAGKCETSVRQSCLCVRCQYNPDALKRDPMCMEYAKQAHNCLNMWARLYTGQT